jgi:drug/metabolite transporter (DMT)-like permease
MIPQLLYGLIIAGCFVGALASYYFKGASDGIDGIASMIRSRGIWIGGILYIVAAANNIFVLKYLDYSIILPLASITYIFTMILANRLLGETITRRKIAGVAAIIVGAVLIANG